MNPRIFSVIVVCYNNEEYIKRCIDSILEQEYPAIELVVADDYSENFEVSEIEKYIQSHKRGNIVSSCVYQNNENLGTVKNINCAIGKSRGEYIKIIAADDALFNERVLSQAKNALDNSPNGIITSDVLKCDTHLENPKRYQNLLQKYINNFSPEEVFSKLCIHNGIISGGVFFKKAFFDTFGLFDEAYRLLEDWPMWLRVTRAGCRIVYKPFYSVLYRANMGIGTGTNPVYMTDKKRVLLTEIIPARKEIGHINYLKARFSFSLLNSLTVRRLYAFVFRRKSAV